MEDLGIKIEFLTKDLEFDKSVAKMNKSINILKKEVSMLNKELKLDPKNVDLLNRKFNNLKGQEELAQAALNEFLDRLETLNSMNVSPFSAEWTQTMSKVEEWQGKLLGIQGQLQRTGEDLENARNYVKRFGEAMQDAGRDIEEFGESLSPISKVGQDALVGIAKSAVSFEDAFADVRKTVNGSETDFREIEDGLRGLATEIPVTADELARVAGLAGQMGVKAGDIVTFTKAMEDFANSTNITADEAVTDIAQIYNVIGKGGDFSTLDNLLSTIVELGNNTATTEKDIVEMFRNISAASSRVDMTEAQMAALAATLSSLGLDKGGASAISKIMTNVDKAVSGNAKRLADWAGVAGMTSKEFRNLWNEDASAGLLAIVEGIAKSNEEGTSFNETLEELGIKEIRQVDTLSRLTNAHADYARNIAMANKAYDKGTALSEEAEKRYETLASQIQILKNTFTEFGLTLGDMLMPYLEWLIQSIQDLAEWLNNLSPEAKEALLQMVAIIAAISPLVTGIGKIISTVGTLFVGISKLGRILKALLMGMSNIVTVIAKWVLLNPQWMAVIALAVAALVLLYNNCEGFRQKVKETVDGIKKLWNKFKETNYIEVLGEKFGGLGAALGTVLEIVKKMFDWFGKLIGKLGEFLGLAGSVSGSLNGIGGVVKGFVGGGNISMISSGGFASGSISVNNTFTITNGSDITRQTVEQWADIMTDRINENLGRMV